MEYFAQDVDNAIEENWPTIVGGSLQEEKSNSTAVGIRGNEVQGIRLDIQHFV